MNMRLVINTLFLNCFFLVLAYSQTYAQPQEKTSVNISFGDSLTLSKILPVVMNNHPSIKGAEEALNAADARIGLAQSGYYPNVNASASYTRIGPVPELNFPPLGTFKLYPENNYSATINYEQTLYDFGKTTQNVNLARESKTLVNQNIDLVKQQLELLTISIFYNIVYLQEAIRIKDEAIRTLKDHLDFIEKKKATGSATQYEYLSTQVRLSNAENQKSDLLSRKKIQNSILNSLLGNSSSVVINVKQEAFPTIPEMPEDSLVSYAINHRVEMKIAQENEKVAGLQYQVIKMQNNPTINAFASGGGKNGFIPDLNAFKANYSAGVGLKVPIFSGNRVKNSLLQAKSTMNTSAFETEVTRRNISNDVVKREANYLTAKEKMNLCELQLKQAREAFNLANVSFRSGTITNLDLLDAETALSETSLYLLQSKIDYAVSVYNLNLAIGGTVY
jgi:outer membrane protein